VSKLKRYWPWAPSVAYMALIAFLSSRPFDGLGFGFDLGFNLADFPWQDKGLHFVEFGVLAIFNAFAFSRTLRSPGALRVAVYAIALTTTWGYLDEVHQAFVPGRTADAYDLLADFIGAIGGTTVFSIVRLARRAR
jgi:hypothetical protein